MFSVRPIDFTQVFRCFHGIIHILLRFFMVFSAFLCSLLSPMVPKWIPMTGYLVALVAHSFGSLCGRFSSKNIMFFVVFGAKPQFSTCFPTFFSSHLHFTQVFLCFQLDLSLLHRFFIVFTA